MQARTPAAFISSRIRSAVSWLRQYLHNHDIAELGRVVMLGPPNQGSDAADGSGGVPGLGWLNGPAGRQLGKGENSVPTKAGTRRLRARRDSRKPHD